MQGFAKSILISILVSVCVLLFSNLVYFFPWYMTLVVETFNLSQLAASDNYVKEGYRDDIVERMTERPVFSKKASSLKIIAVKDAEYHEGEDNTAIGSDDESLYFNVDEYSKPYRQRGEPVTVGISAIFPLSITLWNDPVEREIPVTFTMETVGLKHYKDLPYYE